MVVRTSGSRRRRSRPRAGWSQHQRQVGSVSARGSPATVRAKLHEIVGLYVDPPTHAVVLSIDEKCQIQGLDRTQPGVPMKEGRCGTMTHAYKRHGTTTLLALKVLDGEVIGRCMLRHRHQEFIRFLNAVEAAVPPGKLVHAIAAIHFTPTSASWLNAVESFVTKLAKQRLKRGVFRSIVDLQAAINPSTASSPRPTPTLGRSSGPSRFPAFLPWVQRCQEARGIVRIGHRIECLLEVGEFCS